MGTTTPRVPLGLFVDRPTPRLYDSISGLMRARHMSPNTQKAYLGWIRRFIHAHPGRHPRELGADEINQFLTDLAVHSNVSASTQNQALSALLFLDGRVLEQPPGWLDGIVRAKRPKRLPVSLHVRLRDHLAGVRRQWEADRARGLGRVPLPDALVRKYPNADREGLAVGVFQQPLITRIAGQGSSIPTTCTRR